MTDDVPPFSVSVMETPEGLVVMPHGDLDLATVDEAEQAARPWSPRNSHH